MKIKVLLVMPGKEVQIIKIPESIKFIKSFIGEELQRFKINENTMIIANKKPSNDEFNRIYKGNIILGTFIVVSIKNNRRVSMKKKDTRKFSNMFKLAKHEKKINRYKEEFLEEYYFNQRKMKQKNAKRNKEEIFNIAA
jgi:predicted RNA-binding protein with PUA domain